MSQWTSLIPHPHTHPASTKTLPTCSPSTRPSMETMQRRPVGRLSRYLASDHDQHDRVIQVNLTIDVAQENVSMDVETLRTYLWIHRRRAILRRRQFVHLRMSRLVL